MQRERRPLICVQRRESALLPAHWVQRDDGVYLRALLVVRLDTIEIQGTNFSEDSARRRWPR